MNILRLKQMAISPAIPTHYKNSSESVSIQGELVSVQWAQAQNPGSEDSVAISNSLDFFGFASMPPPGTAADEENVSLGYSLHAAVLKTMPSITFSEQSIGISNTLTDFTIKTMPSASSEEIMSADYTLEGFLFYSP